MNKNGHKIKPQFGLFKEIASLHSLQQSSKKSYKFLSKLKITKKSTQKTEFRKFNLIKSSLKIIKQLDPSSFNPQSLTASQFKFFLKKFYKIHRFSNPPTKNPKEGLIYVSFLLNHGKYLKDLYLNASFQDLTKKFTSRLSLCKIRTLDFNQIFPHEDKPEMLKALFDAFPSTIENLSLIGFWLDPVPEKALNFRFPSSAKNLKKLELGVTFLGEDLKDILESIPDPSKLKSLRFHIAQEDMVSDEIKEFLKRCVNLEELWMKTGVFSITDFYLGATNLKLKKLNIQQICNQDDDLLRLEELILQQKDSLEVFRLKLRMVKRDSYCFGKLFENIKSLKNLKKLDLRLVSFTNHPVILPSIKPLTGVVEALDGLEEINFEEIQVDLENDQKENFENFCKILQQKYSKTLKSLKLSLNNCPSLEMLMQTLRRLPKLEDLTLRNLTIEEDSNFYNEFRDLVCYRNQNLNSVRILEERKDDRNEDCENLVRMFQEIIRKPSMETFRYLESKRRASSEFDNFDGFLDLSSDICKQVYHFKSLNFPFYACRPEFDPQNFDNYKWASE